MFRQDSKNSNFPSFSGLTALCAAMVVIGVVDGCGGCGANSQAGSNDTGIGSAEGFHYDTPTLNCPQDSLDINITSTGDKNWAPGTTVTFKNKSTGQNYDGGASVGSYGLDCGLPAGAPAGTYEVIAQEPGQQPVDTGSITYTLNDCPKT